MRKILFIFYPQFAFNFIRCIIIKIVIKFLNCFTFKVDFFQKISC